MSPVRKSARMSSRTCCDSCRAVHSGCSRSRYFSVTISRIGPTFCAMPPCTRTRLSCNFWRVSSRGVFPIQNRVRGQQPAPADARFRVALLRGLPLDEFDARPHAARILPAAARTRPATRPEWRAPPPAAAPIPAAALPDCASARSPAYRRQSGTPAGWWTRQGASLWECR